MARRTEILNYLVHQLKGISDDPATNRANGIAQLTSGAVSSVTIDNPGRFYDGATVEFSSPGKVTANVIPTVDTGNVTFHKQNPSSDSSSAGGAVATGVNVGVNPP